MKHLKLKKPIMVDGAQVTEVKYDFDNLTQKDISEAEKRMVTSGHVVTQVEEMNYTWHAYLFAAAAAKANPNTDVSDYMRLEGADALRARLLARNFILAAEAGEESNFEQPQ